MTAKIIYESRREEKQLRRIILDVMEICPVRYRREVINGIQIINEVRNSELEGVGIYDLIDFFHRLRSSRLTRNFSANQKDILEGVFLWFDALYLKRFKVKYVPFSKAQRYEEFKRQKENRGRLISTSGGEIKGIDITLALYNIPSVFSVVRVYIILISVCLSVEALLLYFHVIKI
ncbi:hypothetical protein [Pantoea ananatis]|uniref:hypothetical protein n=1 Tax=Pantoea ananas TaxID=553 RepID=UPI001B30DB88|nr:hypothetical protein [Pantoea ananatis]